MELFGRRAIYTDVEEVTRDNVLDVVAKALPVHIKNRAEIEYLYDYYRGKQPILARTKDIRPEICNKIVENRANEIVSFKVGYLVGEPIQYVCRSSGEEEQTDADAINLLNTYVFECDKAAKDKELAEWMYICGLGYRIAIPSRERNGKGSPFEFYTLDPRNTFVIYHNGLGHRPIAGVTYVLRGTGEIIYSVYTRNRKFELTTSGNGLDVAAPVLTVASSIISAEEAHIAGDVPIIEYIANNARLGSFEIVIELLDAINNVESNRLDGIEQFVQALLMIKGADISDEEFISLKELGGLKIPEGGDAKYLVQDLNQTQTQTLTDSMYQTVLTIVGMPNRNGGSSTSDTGSAVIMRDGWSDAEARAKDVELSFKLSEKRFLRLIINYANTLRDMNLDLADIEIRFTRRNYENIQMKAQVLTMMLSNDKIAEELAFEYCGMFADPGLAYKKSVEAQKRKEKETAADLKKLAEEATLKARLQTANENVNVAVEEDV